MKIKQERQTKINDDYLYEEALTSLKQLNQEVLLNDLSQQLKQFIHQVSVEISELQSELKEDIHFTTSTVASVNFAMENFTDKTKENLDEQDTQIRDYFGDFVNFFNVKLEETLNTAQASKDLLMQNIAMSIDKYEERFEQFNNRHDAFYQAFQSENIKLEQLVESFKDSTTQSITVLKEVRLSWLSSIEELQSNFWGKIDRLQELNKDHQTFINQSNDAVTFELSQLKKVHERIEKIIEQHEQRQQSLKHEMEQSINQFKAFTRDTNEQQKSHLETIFDQLRNENIKLETKLEEQKTLIKSNQNMNSIFSITICVMVIALIVLQFI